VVYFEAITLKWCAVMSFDYYKNIGRGLAVASIIVLSSLSAITYHGEAIGGGAGARGGGAGNSQGKGTGKTHGAAHSLLKAGNASSTARAHAAHNSAVILADRTHYNASGNHLDDDH